MEARKGIATRTIQRSAFLGAWPTEGASYFLGKSTPSTITKGMDVMTALDLIMRPDDRLLVSKVGMRFTCRAQNTCPARGTRQCSNIVNTFKALFRNFLNVHDF